MAEAGSSTVRAEVEPAEVAQEVLVPRAGGQAGLGVSWDSAIFDEVEGAHECLAQVVTAVADVAGSAGFGQLARGSRLGGIASTSVPDGLIVDEDDGSASVEVWE